MRCFRAFALMLTAVLAFSGAAFAQSSGGDAAAKPPTPASTAPASSATKPDAGKPSTDKPDAGKPDADKPDAGKPDAGKPDAGKPDAGKPDAGKPDGTTGTAAPEGSGAAPPAPAAPTGDKPKTETSSEPVDGSTYVVRMRDLAQRVDELKEQIRRSHTRLSLLSDTILSGGVGGSRAEIRFANEMSSAFRVTRVLVVLDGAVQYNRQDETGALAKQKEIPIFSGSIPPGDHTLQVLVKLQGFGYGVFSYLRGYKFEVKSSHSFTVTAGKTIQLQAVAFEKGGVTTPLEQRPAMRFVQNIRSAGPGDEGASEAPADAGAAKGSVNVSVGAGSK
jgi:hypothetical protein